MEEKKLLNEELENAVGGSKWVPCLEYAKKTGAAFAEAENALKATERDFPHENLIFPEDVLDR